MDLTSQQISILERLHRRKFKIVAFPMYANYVGVRKGNCAALLAPVAGSGFDVYGQPAYLIGGNLSARIRRDGRDWFVWKKEKLDVTPARLAELDVFSKELTNALLPNA